MKTVLVTGASSGIGKATALLFLQKGYRVIATARDRSRLTELGLAGAYITSLDVSNEESINAAFREILSSFSQIDILVNNAGYAQNGFVEELPPDRLRYQFEVNVFGLVRVSQRAIPLMRKAGKGHIINIGSMGGDFTSPGAGAYHASKYALESISDAMRQELKHFGISVSLIKPGGVATGFVEHADFPQPIEGNPYRDMREKFLTMLRSVLDTSKSSFPLSKPGEVAQEILKTAASVQPKTRVRIGRSAKMIPVLKSLMSDQAFDRMIMKQLGLTK